MPKQQIIRGIHPDGIVYKINNRRLIVQRRSEESYLLASKKLLVFKTCLEKELLTQDMTGTIITRQGTKYAIWINEAYYSRIALELLFDVNSYLDSMTYGED